MVKYAVRMSQSKTKTYPGCDKFVPPLHTVSHFDCVPYYYCYCYCYYCFTNLTVYSNV